MWGSYGSYSSLSSTLSAPMDIGSSSLNARDATCAFPSWPRRSSLDSEESERPTAFLSDDDLLLEDPFEEDVRSEACSSTASSPSPRAEPQLTGEQLFYMQRERLNMQRELMRQVVTEKEQRRHARRSQRPAKKSPKSKSTNMSTIKE